TAFHATDLTVNSGGELRFTISDTAPPPTGIFVLDNNATLNAGSKVNLDFASFLPDSGDYVLLHAAGTLTDNATVSNFPFLYNGSIHQPALTQDLVLSFHRKTATELNLSPNQTAIYEPLIAAAKTDDPFGAALLNLDTEGQVKGALEQLYPL